MGNVMWLHQSQGLIIIPSLTDVAKYSPEEEDASAGHRKKNG